MLLCPHRQGRPYVQYGTQVFGWFAIVQAATLPGRQKTLMKVPGYFWWTGLIREKAQSQADWCRRTRPTVSCNNFRSTITFQYPDQSNSNGNRPAELLCSSTYPSSMFKHGCNHQELTSLMMGGQGAGCIWKAPQNRYPMETKLFSNYLYFYLQPIVQLRLASANTSTLLPIIYSKLIVPHLTTGVITNFSKTF